MMLPSLGNSAIAPYLKIAAILILTVTYLLAISYAFYSLLRNNNAPLPTQVTAIIFSGLGFALQVLTAHQTVSLTEKQTGGSNASPPTP